jgi:hypothetical protein
MGFMALEVDVINMGVYIKIHFDAKQKIAELSHNLTV